MYRMMWMCRRATLTPEVVLVVRGEDLRGGTDEPEGLRKLRIEV